MKNNFSMGLAYRANSGLRQSANNSLSDLDHYTA